MGTSTHLDPEVNVALQGTLDTFALPDVLRLLATTKKTGCVRVTGARGSGSVWVESGGVGTIDVPHAPHATEAVDALFELLRFDEGSFTFEPDVTAPSTVPVAEVEAIVAEAEALLAEWREIESVVPSMHAWVTLRRELVAPTVSIDRRQWVTVVAVGGGASVLELSDALSMPELPVSRAVRELVELGLVDIAADAPAPPPITPKHATASRFRAEPAPEPIEDAPLPAARPIRARRAKPAEPVPASTEPETFVPLELPGQGPAASYDPPAPEPVAEEEVAEGTPEDEELARHLATLSPRAADAIRAAAAAETDEEREAALAAAQDGEDAPINRGVLLKFLSSVKS